MSAPYTAAALVVLATVWGGIDRDAPLMATAPPAGDRVAVHHRKSIAESETTGRHTRRASAVPDGPRIPISFEPNRGQAGPAVRFLARGAGYRVDLTATEAVLTMGKSATPVRFTFIGANDRAEVTGVDPLAGRINYLLGASPASWQTNIPTFRKVMYRALYPGIDLVYHTDRHALEYDFIVAPGADPDVIVLRVDGAERVELMPEGDLVLQTVEGTIRQGRPVIYQEVGDVRRPIDGHYVLRDHQHVAFAVGPYDPSRPLVIDPSLAFSSYLGGSRTDVGGKVAVDQAGNLYLAGSTNSSDFPIANATPLPGGGGEDVFVAKISADGGTLLYATFFGGSNDDVGIDLALDTAGRLFVGGVTTSVDFPIHNALQPILGGAGDGFLVKLDIAGDQFAYATYLGGTQFDGIRSVAVDRFGQPYVTGETMSLDFPTRFPFQPALRGTFDAFVTRFNASGTALSYSTYLGGTDGGFGDFAGGIAVDGGGNAYVTGTTGSPDFPITHGAFQRRRSGPRDAFITKLRADGGSLAYSTYLGGESEDNGTDIALDDNRATIVGFTLSTGFPTTDAFQPRSGGFIDVFVAQLDDDGEDLKFSTYLGGTAIDVPGAVAIDLRGAIYVTGTTASQDFPVVRPIQPVKNGVATDAFVAVIAGRRPRLVFSTFLGGGDADEGGGIAVDAAENAYVTGTTRSVDFPIANALQPARAGDFDAFFLKMVPSS
jgi:hypothetical protein